MVFEKLYKGYLINKKTGDFVANCDIVKELAYTSPNLYRVSILQNLEVGHPVHKHAFKEYNEHNNTKWDKVFSVLSPYDLDRFGKTEKGLIRKIERKTLYSITNGELQVRIKRPKTGFKQIEI